MKKGDKVLLVVLLFLVCGLASVFLLMSPKDDNLTVVIYKDNEVVGEYPFGVEEVVNIYVDENKENYNIVNIELDRVTVIEANCKDELCVKTPSISKGNQNIVCLPHKVLVTIV